MSQDQPKERRARESSQEHDEGESDFAPHPLAHLHPDRGTALRIYRHIKERRSERRAAQAPQQSGAKPAASGQSLDERTRQRLEPVVGADLAAARIHTGGDSAEKADALDARAFTVGQDVHFGAGEYQPGSKEGDRLLAHELTHVAHHQQSGVQRKKGGAAEDSASDHPHVSKPDDPAEKHADAAGDHAVESLHGSPNANKRVQDRQPSAGATDSDWVHYLTELHDFLRGQVCAEKGALLDLRAQRDESPIVGGISEAAATVKGVSQAMDDIKQAAHDKKKYQPRYMEVKVKPPDEGIWEQVLVQLAAAYGQFAGGKPDIEAAKKQMDIAVRMFRDAHRRTFEYKSRMEEGADAAANTLRGVEIGCDVALGILSVGAGAGGANLLKLGVKGTFKLLGEQAMKAGLVKTAGSAALATGANKFIQGDAEQSVGKSIGADSEYDFGKVAREAGQEAVTTFLGYLMGGALNKVFTRALGQILGARMATTAPDAMIALAEKYGIKGAIPPELFVTKGWQFFVGVAGDGCTTTLLTALQVTVEKLRTGKSPSPDQFVTMVIEQMIQNGLLQVVMTAVTHEGAKPASAGSKTAGAGGAAAHEQAPEQAHHAAPAAPPPNPAHEASRQAVIDFYKKAGWSEKRITQHLSGYDLSRPVSTVTLKKGTIVAQWQAPGVPQGNYYAPSQYTPTELGIGPKGQVRGAKEILDKSMTVYQVVKDVEVLKSTCGNPDDIWSVEGMVQPTKGGGEQFFSADKSAFQPVEQARKEK